MLRLTDLQIQDELNFIDDYIRSYNAADGAKFDANANVTHKNIATLESELMKDLVIQINRKKVQNKIREMFDDELSQEYVRQIEDHEIYVHDETSLKPYCASISMYPLLTQGLVPLGGESQPPQHLESFCGSFVNMVFAISAQFAGALATVEFLTYFDYFCRKDFGGDYLNTHTAQVSNHLQHVVYAINQPAAARGYQSVFWNISLYDEHYFNSIFNDFVFPDFTKPEWESVKSLQEFFMTWFNGERQKSILTFPVVTAAMLTKDGKCKDQDFANVCAKQLAEGNSFFIYQSDKADSLASCCRLRNEMADNSFSYSLGAGGVATGSINVITLNLNRLEQLNLDLLEQVQKVQKYQMAYLEIVKEYQSHKMLPVYDAGFITLDKQFLTLGINGMVEAAESRGIKAGNNDAYKSYVSRQLKVIYDANKQAHKEFGHRFNTEFVPAENLGVKNAKWDSADGLKVGRDCYNSYFYPVEDESVHALDKFILHGEQVTQYLDGGSALHLNLEESLDQKQYLQLLEVAAKTGCNYFCINVKITLCNQCEAIDKRTLLQCSSCGSSDIDYGTRVIGYLKRVSAFSSGRQQEHSLRHYHRSHRTEAAESAATG